MRRLAIVTVLSEKVRNGDLVIVENLELGENKTKHLVEILRNLEVEAPALIVLDEMNSSVIKAARNIGRIRTLPISLLNTLDLVNCGKIIMTVDAVRKAEEIWGGARRKSRRSSSSVAA
jgi:large subunit ribosomal protein L4